MTIKRQLSAMETIIQNMRRDAEEQTTEQDSRYITDHLYKHKSVLKKLTVELRQSVTKSRDNVAKAGKSELFRGAGQGEATSSREEETAQKSQDFTEALKRTRSMLSNEIKHSSDALAKLKETTQNMRNTSNEYKTYRSTLDSGKKLISTLMSRENTDRFLLFLGLLIFGLTVTYIVMKRMKPFLMWWHSSSTVDDLLAAEAALKAAANAGTGLPGNFPSPAHVDL
eukprot:CAMPEP_0175124638 /NCGR_PEP_ID=MMETSP0087-20121206/2887_1 /TAXON_ID=136419 /ORGANISM="Unknown Unknown, Strain D1" /LENGTH=225 /DNA_ID=CAMNT_0016406417 /DNA_START=67 /DNA_END=744 /DNA_ORIENTATION=-